MVVKRESYKPINYDDHDGHRYNKRVIVESIYRPRLMYLT